MTKRGSALVCWLAFFFAMPVVQAAAFVFPADGPVPFRKHQVPLEPFEIVELVTNLVLIADAVGADSEQERRGVAQVFALSAALDSGNREYVRVRSELVDREFDGLLDFEKVRSRVRSIWNAIDWLETPEAGRDGQALGACLRDIMVTLNPDDRDVSALKEKGETGAWDAWVAPVSAFRSEELANQTPQTPGDPDGSDPDGPAKAAEPTTLRRVESSLPAILWKPSGEGAGHYPVAKLETLSMKASLRGKAEGEDRSFHVSIGAWGDSEHTGALAHLVEKIVHNRFPDLPEDLLIEIRNPSLEQSLGTKQSHALSAVSTVLAVSALTGAGYSGVILGTLDEEGAFLPSKDPWPSLACLRDAEGLRVIVPTDAEETVSAFLAMEQPGFLLKNEVLMAANLDEILELAADPPGATVKEIFDRFHEIREKQTSSDIGFYLANSFVRQRLIALHKDEPRHLSAKLLALQSVGKRPVSISREVLVSQIRQSFLPIGDLLRREYIAPRGEGIGELYEQCQLAVGKMSQYTSRDDQDVVDRANDVLGHLRVLDRAIRNKRGEFWEAERDINRAKRDLVESHEAFQEFVSEFLNKDD